MRSNALRKKLLRDLWGTKGQAAAAAVVVGAAVGLYVLLLSTSYSLNLTKQRYYERYRMADVFAVCKRAPLNIGRLIAEIPGVSHVHCRVAADVTLTVPGLDDPALGKLVSIPESRRPDLCDIYVRKGRRPDPDRSYEVLVSENFANANSLSVGDTLWAVINGKRRRLRISGIALSPEFVYAIRPGEIFPDDKRFGILWMNRKALASAFNMEGAFNDLLVALAPTASVKGVIEQVDTLLKRYGGTGAVPRERQVSNWYLENELKQLAAWGAVVPLVFLAVAGLLVNVALSRLVAVQRRQIGILKAVGYSNRQVAFHYLNWALLVAGAGSAVGIAVGVRFGAGLTRLYAQFFHFPLLVYRLEVQTVLVAIAVSFAAAVLGALSSVRRAVSLLPAEAMRPAVPPSYTVGSFGRLGLLRLLSPADRMILRNLGRRPGRSLFSAAGVALGCALLVLGEYTIDSLDVIMETQFDVAQRFDVQVNFVEPTSSSARLEAERLPGVMRVEPFRSVPARLRRAHRSRRAAIVALEGGSELFRIVGGRDRVIPVRPGGLTVSRKLADILNVRAGEEVEVEVLEGRRPVFTLPVVRLVEDFVGLNAYVEASTLHRLLQEGETLSGFTLRVDSLLLGALYEKLKNLPRVAGVMIKRAALRSFRETLGRMMGEIRFIYAFFASVVAAGVVYSSMRVSLSERMAELATLQVLGFSRGQVGALFFGEALILTVAGLPVGCAAGYGLVAFMAQVFDFEAWRLPLVVSLRSFGWAVSVILAASALSAFVVRRRLARMDLVEVLKRRE